MHLKSQIPDFKRGGGFTLVELLVVITIIALLIAMLVPALEYARMQSKLAVCGAQQKTIAGAASTYAVDNAQFYPNRDDNNLFDGDPLMMRFNKGTMRFDLRPKYLPYTALGVFTDPLLGGPKIDDPNLDRPLAETNDPHNHDGKNIMGGYALFAGLYRTNWNLQGMEKIGQRFEAEIVQPFGNEPSVRTFGVLVGDWSMYRSGAGNSRAGHPDLSTPPVLRPRYNYQPAEDGENIRYSGWIGVAQHENRPVTLNFAYSDGSVRRFDEVKGNGRFSGGKWSSSGLDSRVCRVRPTYAVETKFPGGSSREAGNYPAYFQDHPIYNNLPARSLHFQLPRE